MLNWLIGFFTAYAVALFLILAPFFAMYMYFTTIVLTGGL
jgi:hypothetical protein